MVSKLEKQIKRLDKKKIPFTLAVEEISSKLDANYNTVWRYLYAIREGVTNAKCQKRYQKRRKKAQTPFEESIELKEPEYFLSITDEKNDFAESEQSKYLEVCLSQLPGVYRKTLEMRFFRDLTLMQVAEIERVTYEAIQQREKKAKTLLKEIWDEYS